MHHWLFLAQRPVNRYSEAKMSLQRLYPGQNSWYQQIYPPPKESKRSPNYSLDPPHPFVKKNYVLSPLDKTRSWIYQTIAVHPTSNLSFSRRGHVSSCCKINSTPATDTVNWIAATTPFLETVRTRKFIKDLTGVRGGFLPSLPL